MRTALVRLHRYAGLVLAGFLCLAGITGALLAWNETLDSRLNPSLFRADAPAPGAVPMDPLDLHALVTAGFPQAQVLYAPLSPVEGGAYVFHLQGMQGVVLPNDQAFVHPYTGALLGVRKWGDIRQGPKNLMPFVERLHHSLAWGEIGTLVFGAMALLWTMDCFVGAWLSLPPRSAPWASPRRKAWLARWAPAWKLRTEGGGYRLTFDLHRACGLWLWLVLLVYAWSSVSFNLPAVYEPVMKTVLAHQPGEEALPPLRSNPVQASMPWKAAREISRRLMQAEALAKGFVVIEETGLQYDPWRAVYTYAVRSSLDVRAHGGLTMVMWDASTGQRLGAWLPTGVAAGDTVRSWMASLHMATMWGWPYRLFVSAMGLAVAGLSVTGVLIWRRKRSSRSSQRAAVNRLRPARRRSCS